MKKSEFYSNPRAKTLMLTYTAILIALAVTLNVFDIPLPMIGSVSFTYIPSFIAGMFLGPLQGLTVGLMGDVIGILIAPKGPWIPLLTLGSALMGLIPGLIFRIKKLHPVVKIIISYILAFCICTAGINTLGMWLMYGIGKKTYWVYFAGRIGTQATVFGINIAILTVLYYPLKKLIFDRMNAKVITVPEQSSPQESAANTVDIPVADSFFDSVENTQPSLAGDTVSKPAPTDCKRIKPTQINNHKNPIKKRKKVIY